MREWAKKKKRNHLKASFDIRPSPSSTRSCALFFFLIVLRPPLQSLRWVTKKGTSPVNAIDREMNLQEQFLILKSEGEWAERWWRGNVSECNFTSYGCGWKNISQDIYIYIHLCIYKYIYCWLKGKQNQRGLLFISVSFYETMMGGSVRRDGGRRTREDGGKGCAQRHNN